MPAGWSTIEIDVADHLIDKEGLLPEPLFVDAMDPGKGLLRLTTPTAATIKQELLALFDQDPSPLSTVPTRCMAFALRRRILDLLATAVELGCQETTPPLAVSSIQAHRLVRKARALLDAQAQGNPTIESAALELGVTTRSLRRCFLGVLGVSPKQYFLAGKLDAARRAMRRHGPATCVVDIAHEFGFVSDSRFVEQFHRHFGQTPSRVLRLNSW